MRKSDALILRDAAATRAAGRRLGDALRSSSHFGALIGLSGELGAGKTSFVGGVLSAFGEAGAVRSPTYTLIEAYERDERTLYHLDLYRLQHPGELEELGLRDLLTGTNILLVEWIERAPWLQERADLSIDLAYLSAGRRVLIRANSATGRILKPFILGAGSP